MAFEMDDIGAEFSDHLSENGDESETFVRDDDKMLDNSTDGTGEVKKKYDPKDPLRPRRKKARRACYACQRAHLTCGDERPCKRCIKRGLADACQDGVRKKAKYLHDAPEEALGPVLGPNYNSSAARTRPNGQRQNSSHSDTMPSASPGGCFLAQGGAATFPVYPAGGQAQVGMPDGIAFNPQASPVSPSFQGTAANAQPQMDGMLQPTPMDFNALFDPSNPALYNFDLEGLNFGSQYAGWEFGILNKMALGAETPPRENSMSLTPSTEANYAAIFGNGANAAYDAPNMMGGDYPGVDSGPNIYTQGNLQHGLPHAYAIAAGPASLASPSTEATASPQANLDASPNTNAFGGLPNVPTAASRIRPKQDKGMQSILGKRQRDSAAVYASVKEPYPYTAGFHNMVSVIKDRLPLNKLLLIARSLGEIRPSFISCTKDLTREDLVFMEKCFQRTLVEFDDFLQHCCAPTIVCRRSGEVAAVNKEFTALTGWTKEVLLGKEPNRNVYIRAPASNCGSVDGSEGAIRTGDSTPRTRGATLEPSGGQPQPVFLAELLDDDSVVQFYRDFAQLAFEDSRGKVQRSCSLMKYRTQEGVEGKDGSSRKDARTGILSSRVTRIDGEHGISRIEKDGKVNCTYCWTIKRDVFDIPMMIIMNFLPRYYPNQEPHQLAV
ncbi:Transcription activator of gluconeogenesis [Tolypocladium paradoxum]|uniref:Transcription activator of gluconeogenesis n=1 Tax=Tolypocladium paradoxum TaxID=94208 RepID=A0A2S4KYE8_9HYPO|nr:Transcription activator of gluconeogenesis [Tolypocladium paradoxum]